MEFTRTPIEETDSTLREARLLITHRSLVRVALGALSAFSVTFLYEYFGGSFFAPLLISGIVAFITAIFTPHMARQIAHVGIRKMLILSTPFFAIGMYGLYGLSNEMLTPIAAAFIYIGATALYKAGYWVPYHVDLSYALPRAHRGRKLATLSNTADVVVVAMPLLGGLLVAAEGYSQLFALGIALIVFSVTPLFFLQERYEHFSWGFFETFRAMRMPHVRPMVWGHIGDGIQSAMLLVVWPLAVFILLKGDYSVVGAITSLTFLVILLIRYGTGWLFDRWDKERLLIAGALLSASGWVLKVFVWTPLQIFAANIYHEMGRVVNRTSVDAMSYEQAADNGRFIDEYTAIKEIALNMGRVIGLALVAFFALVFGVPVGIAFGIALAAIAAIATTWVVRRVRIAEFKS